MRERRSLLAPIVSPALWLLLLAAPGCSTRPDPPTGSAPSAVVRAGGAGRRSVTRATARPPAGVRHPQGTDGGTDGSPAWTLVARLPHALEVPSSSVLADGRVLVTGGDNGPPYALDVAYSYDFAADAWATETPMTEARELHTQSLLGGGNVLVAGGYSDTQNFADLAEVYDPATKTWTGIEMPTPRSEHTGTVLKDGTVLLAGGYGPGSCGGTMVLSSVDLYDPTLGGFGQGSTMNEPRVDHAACLLHDGTVLVTGGGGFAQLGDDFFGSTSDAEIYDPATGIWTYTPTPMNEARSNHVCATLPDGTVLVAGGLQDCEGTCTLSSAEVYDPKLKTWTEIASMASPRAWHRIVPILGGQLLVVGGDDDDENNSLATTEIYDPVNQVWSPGPTMNEPREVFALETVGNNVLAAGGWDSTLEAQNDNIAKAEVINFGAPNGTPCAAAPSCASSLCAAGVCCDTACTGTCMACTAALKGSGADGTCGPVPAGTDSGNQCQDQGAASCGTTGACDGNGACATYPAGTVCLETSPCVVSVCAGGKCGGPNKLDGTACPGGVCIAGDCVPDPGASTGSSSGGTTTGTGTSSSSSSGAATGGGSTTGSSTGGQGGEPAGVSLSGNGCNVGGTGSAPAPAGVGILMLLGMAIARRRRA